MTHDDMFIFSRMIVILETVGFRKKTESQFGLLFKRGNASLMQPLEIAPPVLDNDVVFPARRLLSENMEISLAKPESSDFKEGCVRAIKKLVFLFGLDYTRQVFKADGFESYLDQVIQETFVSLCHWEFRYHEPRS